MADVNAEPENNHWVTTVMVTIVHPKDDTPDSVAQSVSSILGRDVPCAWGLSEVVRTSSVGTLVPDTDEALANGEDIPDWDE